MGASKQPRERKVGEFGARMADNIDFLADGCFVWTGPTLPSGYGVVSGGYRSTGGFGRKALAHRLSFEIHFGVIPDGMQIHHKCSNPLCVNPMHLEMLTRSDHAAISSRTYWDSDAGKARRKRPKQRGPLWIVGTREACKHGHPYEDGSWYINSQGTKTCRVCRRDSNRRAYAKKQSQGGV